MEDYQRKTVKYVDSCKCKRKTKWICDGNLTRSHIDRILVMSKGVEMSLDGTEISYHFDEFHQMYAERYVHNDDVNAYRKIFDTENLLRNFIGGMDQFSVEYRLKRNGNEEIWYSQCLLMFWDKNSDDVMFRMNCIDVTKEKRSENELKTKAETAETANRVKSQFINQMSHDIRTPLNAIQALANIASVNIQDKEKIKDCLDKINQSCLHLINVVDEVSDVSKIENGRMKLAQKKINLHQLMDEMLVLVRPQIEIKRHKFHFEIRNLEHENVVGDDIRIKELFLNVLSNAIKYTFVDGEIAFELEEIPSDVSGKAVYQAVISDNGIGISEEFIGHIFEPFSREESEAISSIQGTGLGMVIAKDIAELMNGHIRVESKLGKGSTFTVTIELKIQEECSVISESKFKRKYMKSSDIDFSGRNILIAEDNEINMEIISEIVGSTGADVYTVSSGKQALELLKETREHFFDMIFMDVRMPEMDGYQATQEIRRLERKDAGKIPIIALSGNTLSKEIDKSRQVGMDGYVIKPFKLTDLTDAMKKWLN